MKRWIAFLVVALIAVGHLLPARAQARVLGAAELEALLAPVALYPDPVLSHILVAATFPEELREAAAWSRANPQLSGENALRAAEAMPWHPSVKALVAFPDLVLRMDQSPQWVADLGTAFLEQEPHVMDTVQSLRRRAQASGNLQSNAQQQVYDQGGAIAVYPAQPQVVYLPWYDPYAVYGPWPWAYRPVYWRPWQAYPTPFAFTHVFFVRSVDWHRRHVIHRPHHRPHHQHSDPGRIRSALPVTVHNHVHPARPIVDSVRLPAQHSVPAQHSSQPQRREVRREVQGERRIRSQAPFSAHTPAPQARTPHAPAPAARSSAPGPRSIVDTVRMHAQPPAGQRQAPGPQDNRGWARRG